MNWTVTTHGPTTTYRAELPVADFSPLPDFGAGRGVPESDIKRMAELFAIAWEKLTNSILPKAATVKPNWNCFFFQIWHLQGIVRIIPGHVKKSITPIAIVELHFAHLEKAAKCLGSEPEQKEERIQNTVELALDSTFRKPAMKNAMRNLARATNFRIFRQIEDHKKRLLEYEDFKMYL